LQVLKTPADRCHKCGNSFAATWFRRASFGGAQSECCNESDSPDGAFIAVGYTSQRKKPTRLGALTVVARAIAKEASFDWLKTDKPLRWQVDCSKLRSVVDPDRRTNFDFLHGNITLAPEVEFDQDFNGFHNVTVFCLITPDTVKQSTVPTMPPPVINESLPRFQAKHPDSSKAAFIMMRFGKTPVHDKIVDAIRSELDRHGIKGLRADDQEYHDDLLPNVQTYMHGCGFGIAVFERIENDEFNPNVGLEVGYLLAMGTPVCFLKDKSLTALHTDLIGKLYRTFDTYNPHETIPKELGAWLNDKGFASTNLGTDRAVLRQNLEVFVERHQPPLPLTAPQPAIQAEPQSGNDEFRFYLNGLDPDELFRLAKAVLVDRSQTISFGPADTVAATLVSKQFLKRVSMEMSLEGMRRRTPTPYNIPPVVWRFLKENKDWLLRTARERNQDRPERLQVLDTISFDEL
jgi:hypothetical protein